MTSLSEESGLSGWPSHREGEQRRKMARLLAYLFAAGATIALLSVVLPHSPKMNERAILALLCLAYAAALGLALGGNRLPRGVCHAVVDFGTILIAGACYFSGESSSSFSFFFLWVGLYSFYFFTLRASLIHLAFVGVAYATILCIVNPAGSQVTPWLLTVGTLTVAGVLIAHLVAEVRSHAADLAVVASASRQVLAAKDPATARSAICESARTVAGALATELLEPDVEAGCLESTATAGVDLLGRGLPATRALTEASTAYGSAQPLFVADLADRFPVPGLATEVRARSCLYQPILREGAAIGVLAVSWEERLSRVTGRVAAAIELLAAEAAVAIGHADLLTRLEAAALTDHLTGLANRRSLFEQLPQELARAAGDGRPLCLAMLDLDNFKRFNDAYGHQAGDTHLREVSIAWSERLRSEDLIARYGGEEFILVLPGCPLEEASQVVERMRAATPGGQTCSAGVAKWDGSETADQLIARVDRALYAAKDVGRDHVVLAA